MNATLLLHDAVCERFPAISAKANREYSKYCGDSYEIDAYSWLHSLADAMNGEMRKSSYLEEIRLVFEFVASTYACGSEEVRNAIDVSFVENLFWDVPPQKAAPYWNMLPSALKKLFVDFHAQPPL